MKKLDLEFAGLGERSSGLRMSREMRQAASDLRRFAREEAVRNATLRTANKKSRFSNMWGFKLNLPIG